jgi:mannose-6-phosphate isomerase-like protein (cupin superfamily)
MHALDAAAAPEDQWENNPYRTLLPAETGQGLEIYKLTVTAPNPHSHDTYDQVYIIESGHGTMEIGEEQRAVSPGWLIYIPRGQRHALTPAPGTVVVLYSVIHHQP